MSGHTPTPWRQAKPNRLHIICETPDGGVRKIVASAAGETSLFAPGEADANARRIVLAVNCHDDLLAAVRELMDQPTMNPLDMTPAQRAKLWTAHANARAAINKAEGR